MPLIVNGKYSWNEIWDEAMRSAKESKHGFNSKLGIPIQYNSLNWICIGYYIDTIKCRGHFQTATGTSRTKNIIVWLNHSTTHLRITCIPIAGSLATLVFRVTKSKLYYCETQSYFCKSICTVCLVWSWTIPRHSTHTTTHHQRDTLLESGGEEGFQ